MSKPWGSAWRLLAALPFVLLLVIIGVKVTMSQGDPASGTQDDLTIQGLDGEAPSATVTLPNGTVTRIPAKKVSDLPSSVQSQLLADASASASATTPTAAPKPSVTAKPKPSATTSAGGGSTGGPKGGGGSTNPAPAPTTTHTADPTPTKTPCTPVQVLLGCK